MWPQTLRFAGGLLAEMGRAGKINAADKTPRTIPAGAWYEQGNSGVLGYPGLADTEHSQGHSPLLEDLLLCLFEQVEEAVLIVSKHIQAVEFALQLIGLGTVLFGLKEQFFDPLLVGG